MRILPDENLPRKLVGTLRAEGHDVEPVHTLRMQGLDNGQLYRFARDNFELCLTRDSGFANNVRQGVTPSGFKLLRVTLPQKPQDTQTGQFIFSGIGFADGGSSQTAGDFAITPTVGRMEIASVQMNATGELRFVVSAPQWQALKLSSATRCWFQRILRVLAPF